MEYIANFVTKSSVLVTKARITKATALIELGFINEAYQIYRRIISLQDLPAYRNRISEQSDRHNFSNFHFPHTECYYNDKSPEDDKNQPAINLILKPVENLENLKKFCSPTVIEMLQYLRTCFLIRLGEAENVESSDKAA